ncbi:uncharacterized protein FHX49_001531 [Microbacterium endophyticum]|uniref:DNA helicase n=1 Tax=Microbacterium endophyticum TaxID=1526412 RepID=A0A7W4V3R2_9MICO|nr:bifunctional RecB family nuclease/DEAD/DEAH box helicase [Microbacterium endophyticum]MBB2975964.1 uncharacterized protein [Microbacterium endophyticum]NIK37667.1 uncharacterized protein [Microbacterium endophyticum]
MRYIEQERRIVWSASDLKASAECEFAWLRAIDAKLQRVSRVEDPEDATLARAARLGTLHERRVLENYRDSHGAGVVEIPETRSTDAAGLAAAAEATRVALADPAARVLYQAAFSTPDFVGFADFLVRDDDDRWVVQDTKLARQARVTALMQLAAYVDQLDALGVPRADRVELLLGDGSVSEHEASDLLPMFSLRRARLRALVADRDLPAGAAGEPIAWGDSRGTLGVVSCGRCATCDVEVTAHRDLLLVAGMRPVQRERLRATGIETIDQLAAAEHPPNGMSPDTFSGLVTQARLQLASPAGVPDPAAENASSTVVPTYEVVFPRGLGALPRPDHGDLFFDFEGDPLYTEHPTAENATLWGIDYLFGWVDTRERYTALWAHSFDEEKRALETFLDLIEIRRAEYPAMHIYHYAPYEPTHLLQMAARYGVREADVDKLLRDGVFVDLYPIVKRSVRVGSRSYSIKKLEPLYMGEEVRESTVQRGDDSIVKYVEARVLSENGDDEGSREILDDLADYNRYDCVSTRRLRDWLVERAREAGLQPSVDIEPTDAFYEPSPRALALTARADALLASALPADVEADVAALRLGSAAIDYYPREAKTFWATHFLRLREPVSVWEDTRDVVVLDSTRCVIRRDWHRGDGQRAERRILELHGEPAPGTRLSEGSNPSVAYAMPAPFPVHASPRWVHVDHRVKILEVLDDGAVVEEIAIDGFTWSELPLAITPASPPPAGNQQKAIDEWADRLIDAAPGFPEDAATDILRRVPPRTRSGSLAPVDTDDVSAIVRSILDLDHSYLAVQGPPGTGKTYVGAHVIAELIATHRYRIGVVAQSHAVVEHMLDRIVAAGVPPHLVGKALKDPAQSVTFTPIAKNGVAAFAAERESSGYVIGGTAWDLAHPARVSRGSLDLLVIDEAGQFSLASTIAVSVSAARLLLLGDPQQLPQVSQGTHPQPVDTSALGWVMAGEAVIAPDRGYFLAHTWRMHPDVSAVVSQLSYAGKLAAHALTAQRSLAGVSPGLHPIAVSHAGNATQSPQEAAEVVRLVGDLLGRQWADSAVVDGEIVAVAPRELAERDIIVVTPYNAQQVLVEEALAAAGFAKVRVGTVDKFQGQEAVVSIVSLAASSGRDAPRGLEFLLLQNRLNVAISRAQHAAYLVYSPGVLDDFPRTPDGVTRLSGFARLVGADDPR